MGGPQVANKKKKICFFLFFLKGVCPTIYNLDGPCRPLPTGLCLIDRSVLYTNNKRLVNQAEPSGGEADGDRPDGISPRAPACF